MEGGNSMAKAARSPARILLIEDDSADRLLIKQSLEKSEDLDLQIEEASHGAEGMAKLEANDMDCVLLDHHLPDGLGIDWLERISSAYTHIPILFLTGQGTEELAIRALKSGAHDYLSKGKITPESLRNSILSALEKREKYRSLEEQSQKILKEERLKVLVQLAGATAHELNQPLTGLIGFCDLLQNDSRCPLELRGLVENIVRSSEQIHDVLKHVNLIHARDFSAQLTTGSPVSFASKHTLLIVEDDDADFEKLSEYLALEARHLQVTRARSQSEALRICGSQHFDLCLVDYNLPDGLGIDLVQLLSHSGEAVPCILVTGKGGENIAAEAFRQGFYDYLPKHEINRSILLRSIWNSLERARMLKEIEEATRRISDLSSHDQLTGLWTRYRLEERLQEEFIRSRRYGSPLTVGLCDLDHFKGVNDTYGHATGDLVLKTAAELMKAAMRQTDFISRYGGEEFYLVFTSTDLDDAALCCERIRQKFESEVFQMESGACFSITASFGVTVCNLRHHDISALILDADKALYQAKGAGRNRVYICDKNGFRPWGYLTGQGANAS